MELFNQTIQYWLLSRIFLVGNIGLTTPTPLKSEFDQVRPSEDMNNSSIKTAVNAWIADPNALQFTYQNNTPWYNVINKWNTTGVTSLVFNGKTNLMTAFQTGMFQMLRVDLFASSFIFLDGMFPTNMKCFRVLPLLISLWITGAQRQIMLQTSDLCLKDASSFNQGIQVSKKICLTVDLINHM